MNELALLARLIGADEIVRWSKAPGYNVDFPDGRNLDWDDWNLAGACIDAMRKDHMEIELTVKEGDCTCSVFSTHEAKTLPEAIFAAAAEYRIAEESRP